MQPPSKLILPLMAIVLALSLLSFATKDVTLSDDTPAEWVLKHPSHFYPTPFPDSSLSLSLEAHQPVEPQGISWSIHPESQTALCNAGDLENNANISWDVVPPLPHDQSNVAFHKAPTATPASHMKPHGDATYLGLTTCPSGIEQHHPHPNNDPFLFQPSILTGHCDKCGLCSVFTPIEKHDQATAKGSRPPNQSEDLFDPHFPEPSFCPCARALSPNSPPTPSISDDYLKTSTHEIDLPPGRLVLVKLVKHVLDFLDSAEESESEHATASQLSTTHWVHHYRSPPAPKETVFDATRSFDPVSDGEPSPPK